MLLMTGRLNHLVISFEFHDILARVSSVTEFFVV